MYIKSLIEKLKSFDNEKISEYIAKSEELASFNEFIQVIMINFMDKLNGVI